MFYIIMIILFIDTIMLAIFALKCNPNSFYLIPMYAVPLIAYAALIRIYVKTKSGKREKLQEDLKRLREENIRLKEMLSDKERKD